MVGYTDRRRGESDRPEIGTAHLRYHSKMSSRLDKPWKVVASLSTPNVDRCVDIFFRPDGTFGFEEFRRDPEDMGAWTPIAYFSGHEYDTEHEAVEAARASVPWLGEVLDRQWAEGPPPRSLDGSRERRTSTPNTLRLGDSRRAEQRLGC